jgi:hypothetical protein
MVLMNGLKCKLKAQKNLLSEITADNFQSSGTEITSKHQRYLETCVGMTR